MMTTNYKCKHCGGPAVIVKRYKGYEYRYCRKCNIKYWTQETKDGVITLREWVPVKRNKYD